MSDALKEVVVEVVTVEFHAGSAVAGFDQAFVRFPEVCRALAAHCGHLGMIVQNNVTGEG